jgi:hypothetical protein
MARGIELGVRPLGIHALVQIHDDRGVLLELGVERALHVSVCAQALLDVAALARAGHQLHRLEPIDVLRVEEHVADHSGALVDLESMACKHSDVLVTAYGTDTSAAYR